MRFPFFNMDKNAPYRKLGLVLFAVSLLIIAYVAVYMYSESRSPENRVSEIAISWYIPEYSEMVEKSDLIVVATVTGKNGVWDTKDGEKPFRFRLFNGGAGDYSGGLFTEYTFRPDEVLKGKTTTVIGRVRGGVADGYTQKATPTSSFEVGDQVLLFLTNNEDRDGNRILWYYVDWPSAFTKDSDGLFKNECYGAFSVEQLKEEIAGSPAVSV